KAGKLEYQFNLGQIYVAGKKWDEARDLFTRLKTASDTRVAMAAKRQLDDLASLQKYGIRPQRAGETRAPEGAASAPTKVSSSGDDDYEETPPKPAAPKPSSSGPVQHLKGKLVASDCAKAPEATLTFLVGMKTYKMHTSDFKSMLVIGGEEQFSCDWKNKLVSV